MTLLGVCYCRIFNFTCTFFWTPVALPDCTLGSVVHVNHGLAWHETILIQFPVSRSDLCAAPKLSLCSHDHGNFPPLPNSHESTSLVQLISLFPPLPLHLNHATELSATLFVSASSAAQAYGPFDHTQETAVTDIPSPTPHRCWVCPVKRIFLLPAL